MSRRLRLWVFAVGGTGLLAVLLIGFGALPAFGDYHAIYGLLIDRIEPGQRHATDLVTALNFDIRAFDTLGEEFILFASVAGVALLLRHLRSESEVQPARDPDSHRFRQASPALRATSIALLALLISLGVYVVIHGALTPGGGFQGGIVLAAGPLAILLGGRYFGRRGLAPHWALEATEALGAASYTLIGLGGLIAGTVYLQNFLPLGSPGQLLSAGMIPLNSIAVGVEVTGAFLLLWTEFLDQGLVGGGA
jgi:multicomponent Na+:H+ antiporter subunit B